MWQRVTFLVPLCIAVAFSSWLAVMVADRESPTTILGTEVISIEPWPGGEVHVRYHIRRFRSCGTRIERVLYDASNLRIPLAPREFAASPGPIGDDMYSVSVMLPKSMTPGRAIYRITSVYTCNIFHHLWPITVVSPDVTFEVHTNG